MSTATYVDRVEASKILKVSTRTIDRYMRKYRFKTRKDGRRVLIKQTDVDRIIKDQIGHLVNMEGPVDLKDSDKVSNLTVKDIKVEKIKSNEKLSTEDRIYKDLYHETKKELKERQDRLEAATYRVGQLEAQSKNMVPMLDFTKKEKELQQVQVAMENKVKKTKEEVIEMEGKLRSERIAKWIYLSLVGLLLVAEPILFLLWAFN